MNAANATQNCQDIIHETPIYSVLIEINMDLVSLFEIAMFAIFSGAGILT